MGDRMIYQNIKRGLLLLFFAAFLGIYTAEIVVMMPDWWEDFVRFWMCR
jgi:hypothetical protein